MNKPSIGRIVRFNASGTRQEPALIVFVHSERCVTLVWNAGGTQRVQTSVELGDNPGQWMWPTHSV